MRTYTIEVRYGAAGDDAPSQVHAGLDEDRAWVGVEAFLRDLFGLQGAGVASVTVSAELPAGEGE